MCTVIKTTLRTPVWKKIAPSVYIVLLKTGQEQKVLKLHSIYVKKQKFPEHSLIWPPH